MNEYMCWYRYETILASVDLIQQFGDISCYSRPNTYRLSSRRCIKNGVDLFSTCTDTRFSSCKRVADKCDDSI